jgi:hypothetical protein
VGVVKQTVLLGVVVASLCPRPCWADGEDAATRRAARNLGVAGVEAYQTGEYATANDKLDKAYRALRAPSLGLWSARALAKLNRLVEAAERYQEVQRLDTSGGEAAVQRQAQSDASDELAKLAPQIPNLIVRLEGAKAEEVQVEVDGAPVATALIGESRPVDPGKHTVRGVRGEQVVAADVTVALGESQPVTLKFKGDAAASPPKTAPTAAPLAPVGSPPSDAGANPKSGSLQRTAGFVALGVGGAGLVFGGVATVLALGKKGDIKDNPNCQGSTCFRSEEGLVNSYKQWRTLSGVGLIGGGVLAAAGLVLVFTAPAGESQVAFEIGPRSIALGRTF